MSDYFEIEGHRFPTAFPEECIRSAIAYRPRAGDVFVVAYPKCGTHWAHNIATLILRRGEPTITADNFFTTGPFIDLIGAACVESMPRPGAIKTHLPFGLAPWSSEAKYIYVSRNPKDCLVAYYYNSRNLRFTNNELSFDEIFEKFISGDKYYGDFFDHQLGWYAHRNEPNVLWVTYEQLKEDISGSVRRMADFLDVPLDQPAVDAVVRYSDIGHMRKVVNAAMDGAFAMDSEKTAESDLPDGLKKFLTKLKGRGPTATNFVRKGVVGDWHEHLSEEQSRRMDDRCKEKTRGSDIAALWEKYM